MNSKHTEFTLFKPQWHFHTGEYRRWAMPSASDSGWRQVFTSFGKAQDLSGSQGIVWFRLWFHADTSLTHK